MKKVLLDIDGVLAEFIHSFTDLAYDKFKGPVLPYKTVDQEEWDFNNMPKKVVSATWKHIKKYPEFWLDLDRRANPEDFARIDLMDCDYSRYEFYFVTSRPEGTKFWSEHWLRKMGVSDPTVVISSKKGQFCEAVGIDFSLDDRAENAQDMCVAGNKSCILDLKYNKHAVGPVRVATVREFLDMVEAG